MFFLSLVLSAFALAQETLVISASREGEENLPFAYERVNGEEWERRGSRVESALQTVPGLAFSSSGGPGQSRSVFLRGARAEDTLVLIDGVPVNDPLSPSRSFDFGQIPASDIRAIEVKKGPQSVFYGSGAMGGVIEILTRRTEDTRLRLEGGSYGTMNARASHLGLHGGYESVQGFSAADAADGNTERDGHKAWSLGGARDFSLGENAALKVQGLYHSARTDTDRHGGPGGDSTGTYTRNSQLLFRADTLKISGGGYEWQTSGFLHSLDRDDNTAGPAFYRANLWQGATSLKKRFGRHYPAIGGEYREEAGRATGIEGRRVFQGGAVFAEDQYTSDRWQLAGGGRMDFHSEHERASTYRAGAGYWIVPQQLRGKTTIGSGFKAPSLFQTYSNFGTPGLRPSRSIGGDVALEYTRGEWSAELAHFRNYFHELIDFDLARSRYFNTGRAETSGFELGAARSFGLFRATAAFTHLRSRDRATGQKLLRRPAVSGALELAYQIPNFAGAAARLRYVGEREDIHPVLFSRQSMPAFFVLGADFFHRIRSGWRLNVRGENLLNRHYQETSGFGTPGRSFFAAVEADL